MKLETAKSLLLVVLIGTSMILTFGMWNYQADYDPLNERSVEAALRGVEKSVDEIIMPSDIIFKQEGNYYTHANPNLKEQFYDRLQEFRITEMERLPVEEERTSSNYEIEVIFPQEVPFLLFDRILQFEDETAPFPTFSIDRFYITFDPNSKSLNLEFISVDGREKVEAEVTSTSRYQEVWDEMNRLQSEDYQAMTLIESTETNIYIPREVPAMHPLSIFFEQMDKSVLQEMLFENTSGIRGSATPGNGYLYATDVRQLTIERNVMEYIYLEQTESMPDLNLIENSIQNINGHSGFTEDFRLMNIDNDDTITYQMYYEGYPVFQGSSSDISTIKQTHSNQHLLEYKRPAIYLDTTDIITKTKKEMRSGEELLEDLAIIPKIDMDAINDLKVGYKIQVETDDNGDYVSMEPEWFMKVNNSWSAVPYNQPGDAARGGD
ncbi:two-component system activity regulator YycH [Oceanobacillus sp. 1P07AA]|uniref:two-component system activity regulator YycH n=1 Tax=Oceanobacillus sp. 1P07AA TaxID=3132293 RepID=UPI0039A533FE